MRRLLRLLPLLLFCVFITRCGENPVAPDDDPRPLTLSEHHLVSGFNKFGLKLFREVTAADEPDSNVFVSPLSVSMALGMTLNGAAGTTEEAMKTALGFAGMDMTEIDESYQSLMALLEGLDPEVVFEIGNSIWYDPNRIPDLKQTFTDACQAYFDAQVAGLSFGSPDAMTTINNWVDEQTHGKIEKIIESPIPPLTVMYLINAIYFLGTWTEQFDPENTEDDEFVLRDGSTTPCKMMQRPGPEEESGFSACEDGTVQVVDLPYADGWFSMMIVLPHPGVEIGTLIADLDDEMWKSWSDSLEHREGMLRMPKFEIECEYRLNDILTILGMGIAFTTGADFSGMSDMPELFITEVKHKTFVRVDEEGTEAAAVTSVSCGATSVGPEPFYMEVDRPFLFAIRERHSGTVLFMGKIADPGYE